MAAWTDLLYRATTAEARVRLLEGTLAMRRIEREDEPLHRIDRAVAVLRPVADRPEVARALAILRPAERRP
jgi:hypothetical protein